MQDDNGTDGKKMVKGEFMKTQVIAYPEATGTHNGREYKGITIAISGKAKGISRAYLPDAYDEDKGERVAVAKMEIKRSRAKVTDLNAMMRNAWKNLYAIMDDIETMGRKVEKEETKQANYRQSLKDEV